jgi:hypothetical protein
MSIFSATGHAFEHAVRDVEHGVEGAAKGFLTGGPLGAVAGGLAGSKVFSAIGDVAKDVEHGAEHIAKGVEHSVEGVVQDLGHGFQGMAAGFLSGGPLGLQQTEADLSLIRSLIYGGGSGPGTTSIGDNSGLGGLCPFQNSSPFDNQGGAPIPFTPTQTNQKAQLIADAQFIAQNSANPAEASQVAQAQNDVQYREANIISNASFISHSNVPASVLPGAMNQIVSDASIGNEASLVGDLNQLSSARRQPEGKAANPPGLSVPSWTRP